MPQRYSYYCAVSRLDLNDLKSVRTYMKAFDTWTKQTNVTILTDPHPAASIDNERERAQFHQIIHHIQKWAKEYPLLLHAMIRWSKAFDGTNEEVKKATADLEALREIRDDPRVKGAAYLVAYEVWKAQGGYRLGDDVPSDAEEENEKVDEDLLKDKADKAEDETMEMDIDEQEKADTDEEAPPKKVREAFNTTNKRKITERSKTEEIYLPMKKRTKLPSLSQTLNDFSFSPINVPEKPKRRRAKRPPRTGEPATINGRRLKACARCREGHIQCDKAEPKCGNCTKAGKECVKQFYGDTPFIREPGASIAEQET